MSPSLRFRLPLAALSIALLSACADPVTEPSRPRADAPRRALGVVEVTISGIGSGAMSSSARFTTPSSGEPAARDAALSLAPVPGGDGTLQLQPVSTGSFTIGTRGAGGERFVYATYRVRNATADGTAYASARQNLTFLAVGTASTFPGTAVSRMVRFDGTDADAAIALQMRPTGAAMQARDGGVISRYPDVLQVLTESEAALVSEPAGVTNVFPYGFVVANAGTTGTRTLPANPAVGQFDGLVTFAFRIPLQATPAADPFQVSVQMLALDDEVVRMTQSREEQHAAGDAALHARAASLGASLVTLLPGSAYGGHGFVRSVCEGVRTAGSAGAPSAFLLPPASVLQALSPNPRVSSAGAIPGNSTFAATFDRAVSGASPVNFTVNGAQGGRAFVGDPMFGDGTTTVSTLAASFAVGELVEVTVARPIGVCEPYVARYRVGSPAAIGRMVELNVRPLASPTTAVSASALADLDGDGRAEYLVEDTATVAGMLRTIVRTWRFNGIEFIPQSIGIVVSPGATAGPLAMGDLNADGHPDAVLVEQGEAEATSAVVRVSLGNGALGWTPADGPSITLPRRALGIAIGDVNADGRLDAIVLSSGTSSGPGQGSAVHVLLGDGAGRLEEGLGSPIAVGPAPFRVQIEDMNRDGRLDLVVLTRDPIAPLSVMLGNNGGGFTHAPGSPSLSGLVTASDVLTGDFSGDGIPDAVTLPGSEDGAKPVLLIGDGTGAFVQAFEVGAASANRTLGTAADFNGDGRLDLALATPALGTHFRLLLNQGGSTFAPGPDGTSGGGAGGDPLGLLTGEIDGDGRLDVLHRKTALFGGFRVRQ